MKLCALLRYRLSASVQGEGGGVDDGCTPIRFSLSFFLENKISAPDVFSSRSFIPHADFESSLVMVSCYGYVGVIFHVKHKKLSLLAVST